MKITIKLILAFLFITLLTILVLSYVAFHNGQQTIKSNTYAMLESINILKAQQLDDWFQVNLQNLIEFSARSQVISNTQLLRTTIPGTTQYIQAHDTLITHQLARMQEFYDATLTFTIINPDTGQVMVSTDSDLEGKYREDENYFIEGLKGPFIDTTQYDMIHAGPVLHLSVPVVDEDGMAVGVLTAHANLDEMTRLMQQKSNRIITMDSYLVNASYFLITQPNLAPNAEILKEIIRTEATMSCAQEQQGYGKYLDYRSIEVYGWYQWIPQYGFCNITEIDVSEAQLPIKNLQHQIIITGTATFAVALLIALFLASTLTRPITDLHQAVLTIGEGNLDAEIIVKSRDEIGELADAFTDMTRRLIASNERQANTQRMLLALNSAGQKVQQILDETQIVSILGTEIQQLNLNAFILKYDESIRKFRLLFVPQNASGAIPDFQKNFETLLTGYTCEYSEELANNHYYHNKTALYKLFSNSTDPDTTLMNDNLRGIYSPIFLNQQYWGALIIIGEDVSPLLLPGFAVFTNQAGIAMENAQLVNSLEDTNKNLENRVAERTRLLQDSEARYRILAEASPEMIFLVNRDMELEYANRFTSLMVTGQESIPPGTKLRDLLAKRSEPLLFKKLPSVIYDAKLTVYESPAIYADGKEHWFKTWLIPIKDEHDQVDTVLGISQDITEHKRTLLEIEEQQKRFIAILENFPEILYVSDPETYEVLFVNKVFRKMLGDDPVGAKCFMAFQGLDSPCPFCTNNIILKTKEPYEWEYYNAKMDRHFLITDQIIDWPDGRDVRFELAIDISKRKLAENQLQVAMEDLKRSNRELEQFAYVASHDLQEPLRMVSSYMQLIERRYKDQLDENASIYINYAVDGANRMKVLINDLLNFSRVGTRGKDFVKTDLNHLVERIIKNNLKLTIETNQAEITWDTLPEVMVDDIQIAQVFQNLLANAIKFHSDQPPVIHIGAMDTGAFWEISLQDNGIGIDPKYFDKIFIIFQRLHTIAEYQGTGIGLAICKKIIERHGGTIWVKSQLNEGSTFYFTLPKRTTKELKE